MTHALSITDGTTTLALNDLTTVMVVSYAMQSPEVARNPLPGGEDGPMLSSPAWSNVTESMTLLIRGANPAAARATLNTLERLIDRARQNEYGWGRVRCYLQAQLASEADTWRSEILVGRVTPTDPMGDVWKNQIEVEVIITRRHYWEGPETALLMSSTATAETTDPVTWHNGGDNVAGERNWINIGATRVAGVLPTPPKLVLTLTGTDQQIGSVWIGNTVWMDPANLDPIRMGSEAASGASRTWATPGWHPTYTFVMTAATLNRMRGQMVRPLAAFSTLPNVSTLQRAHVDVSDLSGSILWMNDVFTRETSMGTSVLDYGPMPMPPGGDAATSLATLRLQLQMNKVNGDSVVMHSLHLMPSGEGVLRLIQQTGPVFVIQTGRQIVDDGPERLTYIANGAVRYPVLRGYHAPVHLWPGRQNRLRVLVAADPWAASIAWTAQAFYRPRRLTL